MPSKNKNIIRRRKTRKQQHRSRKHKRNNNNARNQTIRGGFRWPWKNNRVHPGPTDPLIPPSQPHLPTNVDSVKNALFEETSRQNRDTINQMKQLIEPQTTKMKDLTDEYKMLKEILDDPDQKPDRRAIHARRTQIRDEIARIKREKIDSSRVEDIERDIRTREREDASYRRRNKLPLLPPDDIPDADAAMTQLTHDLDVAGTGVNRQALNAEFELGVKSKGFQSDIHQVMSEMSDSPRGSTPSRDATHDDAAGVGHLPPGLPPGHRRAHLERGPPSYF